MHSKSRTTEARLLYSISTRVPAISSLIICSLAHVPKPSSTLASKKTFEEVTPEPQSIIEMHGRLFETFFTQFGHREANHDSPICTELRGTEEIVERQEKELDIPLSDLPGALNQTVVVCSDRVRITRYLSSALPATKIFPGVVWFEEVPHLNVLVQKGLIAGAITGILIPNRGLRAVDA